MLNLSKISALIVATLASIATIPTVKAAPAETLTVVVNGIRSQKGEICIGVYSQDKAKAFPLNTTDVLKSACKKITGNSLKHQFPGLKPGNYAVAIVDDQNGDRKLNRDFFGIPTEGFGISKNPTVSVQTGTPKFRDASFALNKNTTINITVKYSLDP
ncbi:DUF2141 domain-containing protein [Tolypothrix sp. FACHB-123]|uniref:DUF2141 domain-containing protein n=1 Tax=Tolypothrix sp. FACHB-123 TaxID=2692868 RepID=UPI0016872C24|nr:DUF2141 domain-containing protein [Tolypothrix sp. FACHB-123]MBD2355321.1 DUF2141 domain-containing protein [Tolypothrix sp. FACHB-123]